MRKKIQIEPKIIRQDDDISLFFGNEFQAYFSDDLAAEIAAQLQHAAHQL